MDPKKKYLSRNEERILAKKRGFLGVEQHNSFLSFYSPKEEEIRKLARWQKYKASTSNLNFYG